MPLLRLPRFLRPWMAWALLGAIVVVVAIIGLRLRRRRRSALHARMTRADPAREGIEVSVFGRDPAALTATAHAFAMRSDVPANLRLHLYCGLPVDELDEEGLERRIWLYLRTWADLDNVYLPWISYTVDLVPVPVYGSRAISLSRHLSYFYAAVRPAREGARMVVCAESTYPAPRWDTLLVRCARAARAEDVLTFHPPGHNWSVLSPPTFWRRQERGVFASLETEGAVAWWDSRNMRSPPRLRCVPAVALCPFWLACTPESWAEARATLHPTDRHVSETQDALQQLWRGRLVHPCVLLAVIGADVYLQSFFYARPRRIREHLGLSERFPEDELEAKHGTYAEMERVLRRWRCL